ncbi:Disintegrin [Haliangium ochraceum]|uniref:Disintegrin n=1 Tax=Haliangium ochraceum (strain DSM 14365 / JCM 11303 / SMP-2) TaxID=502025 RepID=D0LJR1_HALO1|nr:Disintegrin [Haliangium ochraceum]ACY18418.1 Disintegrin [Haliangium ochraceum DSM 14365]
MKRSRSRPLHFFGLAVMAFALLGCSGDDGPTPGGPDAAPGSCGNGVLDNGEMCDPMIDGCCSATCDGLAEAGTECRAVAGACDVAETCSGTSASCPADVVVAAGTECRASTGTCDPAEACDGAVGVCPDEMPADEDQACDDCVFGAGNCSTCSAVGECLPATGLLVINELDVDRGDGAQFIELYDGGIGGTSLDGLLLVFYDGDSDTVYVSLDLTGNFQTDDAGFFLLASQDAPFDAPYQLPPGFIQNGTDAVALYRAEPGSINFGDPVTTDDIMDAVVYGLSRDAGLLALLPGDQEQPRESSSGNASLNSLQRTSDGAGGPLNLLEFVPATPTPGAANAAAE